MSEEDKPKPKWGAGTLQAMGRQGFNEIRNALYPESNIAVPAEHGTFGTTIPSEVQRQRDKDPDVSRQRLDAIIGRSPKTPEPDKDHEPERE